MIATCTCAIYQEMWLCTFSQAELLLTSLETETNSSGNKTVQDFKCHYDFL